MASTRLDRRLWHYQLFSLVILLLVCFAVAAIGGLATAPSVPNWYAGLTKPSWTPPD